MARVARLTLAYYAATTVAAVFLGILLVVLIQPGRGSPFSKAASGGDCETTSAQVCCFCMFPECSLGLSEQMHRRLQPFLLLDVC